MKWLIDKIERIFQHVPIYEPYCIVPKIRRNTMLDDKVNKAMEEMLQRGAALINALRLTPVEREYAMEEAQRLIDTVTEAYFNDDHMKGRTVRPIAVAAAVAFSLGFFDRWVTEIQRKFPDVGK